MKTDERIFFVSSEDEMPYVVSGPSQEVFDQIKELMIESDFVHVAKLKSPTRGLKLFTDPRFPGADKVERMCSRSSKLITVVLYPLKTIVTNCSRDELEELVRQCEKREPTLVEVIDHMLRIREKQEKSVSELKELNAKLRELEKKAPQDSTIN